MDIGIHGRSRSWVGKARLLGMIAALATITTLTLAGARPSGPAPASTMMPALPPAAAAASVQTGVAGADEREFFTRLASFLTCSHEWLEILARLLGYGDTPLIRVVTVADTCHPGSGLYAIGRWIGGRQPVDR